MNYKKITCSFLIFILIFGICSTAFAAYDIPNGYTPIYTAADLNNIRNNPSGKYILMNNIDLSAYENWVPIGTEEAPFKGILDGDNYTINNMNIKKSSNYVGLLGYINSSKIRNLIIENAQIEFNTAENIILGLLCGQATDSIVSNCKGNGTVNIETKGNISIGGIIGIIWSNHNAAHNSYVSNCSNNTDISLIGKSNSSTKTKHLYVGGIVGKSNAPISQCCNKGNIDLSNFDSNSNFVDVVAGGICGYTKGDINDCYNIGMITAAGIDYAVAGGIAGYWESGKSIENLYNIGTVDSILSANEGLAFDGALIGYEEGELSPDSESNSSKAFLSNCYYINSGLSAAGFLGSCSAVNVKTLSEEEFKSKDSFIGFDFKTVWEMDEEIGRPILKNKSTNNSDNQNFLKVLKNIWDKILTFFNAVIGKIISFVGF